MKHRISFARRAQGFSLVEVLVALVVTAVGLLGLAFLISFSVQRTQSTKQIGVATDMAQEVLDMMRANRLEAFRYIGPGAARATACAVAEATTNTPTQRRRRWDCRVATQLPGSTSNITLADGVATVTISWNRDRSQEDADNNGTLTFTTRL